MLCDLCKSLFTVPPEFIPFTSQDPRRGKKYHHQPSIHHLATSATTCHFCALLLETLKNEINLVSIDYTFQKDPLLMVLFTDEAQVYKYLRVRPSTSIQKPIPLTELWYEQLGGNTGSVSSIELARSWVNVCEPKTHPSCFSTTPKSKWFPARVIDVGDPRDHPPVPPRLVLKRPSLLGKPYVTLSHCWGGSNPTLLTDSTISEYQKALRQLPKSFQDACDITRQLGFRYLWIDSLCIIQQQPSLADWLVEGPLMGAIYKNSSLTISALAAENSQGGCFQTRDPLPIQPCKLVGRLYPDSDPEDIWVYDNRVRFLDTEPSGKTAKLNTRGWVMQERVFSNRVLHFGAKQLFWECNTLQACEAFPESLSLWTEQDWEVEKFKTILSPPIASNRAWESPIPAAMDARHIRYADWQVLVGYYVTLELTYGSDKLMAISALAQEWERLLGGGEEYLAGLWKSDLCRQLLWRMDFTEVRERKRFQPYRAPTWSWASVEGAISTVTNPIVTYTLDPKVCTPKADVISTFVRPVDGGHPTGQVIDANIALKGRVKAARLKKADSGVYRLDDLELKGANVLPTLLHPDFDLEDGQEIRCLLLLTVNAFPAGSGTAPAAFGLLLEPAGSLKDTYGRLGTFKLTGGHCSWFNNCDMQKVILI